MNDGQNSLQKSEAIRGQIAEVVSDREVIFNRGSQHGVEEGAYFAILDPATNDLTDPETNQSMGSFRRVKIVVVAAEVAPRFTLAKTFKVRTVNKGGTGSSIPALMASLSAPNYVEQVERLRLAEDAPRPLDPKDSIVHRGDPVEEVSPEDAEDVKSIAVWE
ncbi:hypothetical protein IFT90_02595 [Frigoribacterium sp. CFBP 8766]|uniref:hypothetical protein n=1 Tax=Frigoribacterium sp. CFBP 8766 TaxID=2775273 RepID=UPI00177FA70E|nr:hypothetical protein [Frigoribacterium sp. CFBP 8766]MBD8583444.1 hypothetical protein [Frigoribacterium sp. CFBP 8766]